MEKQDLIKQLDTLPATISRLESEAEDLHKKVEMRKAVYDNAYNSVYMKNKAYGKTDTECKARAKVACYKEQMKLIIEESKCKKKVGVFNEAVNQFTSARKIANLMQTEWDIIASSNWKHKGAQ